jgi:hypothetical protein
MRRRTDIIFGVTGQSLVYRVPQGRPSGATFDVFHESATDDAEPEWSGTATVESVDTTLSTDAGVGEADRTLIPVASSSNVTVGRRYLLSQSGRKEQALIVAKDGNNLYASAPLQNTYTAGADFEGTHISAAVDAAWVADEANLGDGADPSPDYRVRYLITVGGESVVAYQFFDLVRGALEHGVTMHDVEDRFWNVIDSIPVDHRADQGARLLAAAWEDMSADLAGNRVKASALRDGQLVDQLLIRRLRLTFAENGHIPPNVSMERFLDYAAEQYARFLERHFILASEVAVADGTGGATARKRAAPPPWRS